MRHLWLTTVLDQCSLQEGVFNFNVLKAGLLPTVFLNKRQPFRLAAPSRSTPGILLDMLQKLQNTLLWRLKSHVSACAARLLALLQNVCTEMLLQALSALAKSAS
jgi:hypothetical protein